MPDRIVEQRERHARGADRDREGFPERPWIERFALSLPRGAAILDLGCGSGEPIARYLIDHGFSLTGVDGADTMIDLARTRFPRQRWLQADMRRLVIDERFDGALAWDSLVHIPQDDQDAMIARIASWLKPGGRFLFNAGPTRGVTLSDYRGEPVSHASLDPAEYRAAFARAGLMEVAHVAQEPACGGSSIWLTRRV